MNTTLLIFISTTCVLLCLMIFIYIGKQVIRLIRARNQKPVPSVLPFHRFTTDESVESINTEPLPFETAPQRAALQPPAATSSRHQPDLYLKKYDINLQPLSHPAKVLYASEIRNNHEPSLVFAPSGNRTS